MTTFQWNKDGIVQSVSGQLFSFQKLRLSDAGHYTCSVTVNAMTYNSSKDVILGSENVIAVCTNII